MAEPAVASTPDARLRESQLGEDWVLRPWLLGGLLALCGLAVHLLLETDSAEPEAWRAAGAAFFGFGGVSLAFALTELRLRSSLLFALLIGLVMAGLAYHATRSLDHYAGEEFAFAAGVFFTLLALPLFQAGFHRTRFATDYRETHFHVWGDAVCGGGAFAFMGLSWGLLYLLNELFNLVGIWLIGVLIAQDWFGWTFAGATFGAALGVLRNNLKVIGTLQNVVMLVFALLAVPLAVALLVFLLALAASGGAALWEATDAATPVLLACAAGAFILCNAVIRDTDETGSRNRVMLLAGAVLAAGILPLVVFAAISMGIRINQHGLSPERIWALIAIAVASAYGLAAWVALARGRRAGWSEGLRQANLRLAAGVCVLALILALPLWDFGSLSARNQVGRLASGKVQAAEFDFAALRWDFGDAGREALAELGRGEGEVAELARAAEAQTERPWDAFNRTPPRPAQEVAASLRVQPEDPALRALVLAHLRANPWICSELCVAVEQGRTADGRRNIVLVQRFGYERLVLGEASDQASLPEAVEAQSVELKPDSRVELREETVRRIYVDGQLMGGPALD